MKLLYGTSYYLTQGEQKIIKGMSDIICSQDRSYFKNNFKRDKSIPLEEMNLNGFGAEFALCKLCGISFDSSTVAERKPLL